MSFTFLENKRFESRVPQEDVSLAEIVFGYLIGPSLAYLLITALAGNYLIQFYTDVLGVSGTLISIMPFIAKIFAAFTNILIGKLIDKTSSTQGKARPWIFVSGLALSISGILLYAVPKASLSLQLIWIVFSYNLFFAGANNVYLLSHTLMLPRSTRNSKKRDTLSLLKNVSESMIPGTLSAVIMPVLVKSFGVGRLAQSKWFSFMLAISVLAIPGCLLEYYFTRERVDVEKKEEVYSFKKQFADFLHYKPWVYVITLFVIKTIDSHIFNATVIYFCNWVLSNSVAEGSTRQVLFNVLGQFPLGPGLFLLMPILKKHDKKKVMTIGFALSALASVFVFMNAHDFKLVLAGTFVKSIGGIATFLSVSLLSDVLDGFERKFNYRCDTFSITCTTLIALLGSGVAQSLLLFGINTYGYVAPQSAAEVIVQNEAIRTFFNFTMNGIPVIGYAISVILLIKLSKTSS